MVLVEELLAECSWNLSKMRSYPAVSMQLYLEKSLSEIGYQKSFTKAKVSAGVAIYLFFRRSNGWFSFIFQENQENIRRKKTNLNIYQPEASWRYRCQTRKAKWTFWKTHLHLRSTLRVQLRPPHSLCRIRLRWAAIFRSHPCLRSWLLQMPLPRRVQIRQRLKRISIAPYLRARMLRLILLIACQCQRSRLPFPLDMGPHITRYHRCMPHIAHLTQAAIRLHILPHHHLIMSLNLAISSPQ